MSVGHQTFTEREIAEIRAGAERSMLAIGRRLFPGRQLTVNGGDPYTVVEGSSTGLDVDGERDAA